MNAENNNIYIPDNAKLIHNILCHAYYECNLVGGCVRDFLLGKEPDDYDLCTDANPNEVQRLLKKAGIRFVDVGIQFGTVTALINHEKYEITTYRKELEYSEGNRSFGADFVTNVNADLSRRDFTINAMAYDMDRNLLIDPYSGKEDLQNMLVKAVGDPNKRVREDPLRILRGLRFAINYGFSIDPETKDSFFKNRYLLRFVPKERITSEFKRILICNKPISKTFLEYAPIIFEVVPELESCYKFDQNNKYHTHDVYEHILNVVDNCNTDKFEIKMAALLHDIGKPESYVTDEQGHGHFYGHADVSYRIAKKVLVEDFRVSTKEEDRILSLTREHDHDMPVTLKSMRRFVNSFDEDFIKDWMILKKADALDHLNPDPQNSLMDKYSLMTSVYNELIKNESRLTVKSLSIDGNNLFLLGLRGSEIGNCLKHLLNEVINENIQNNKESLIREAESYQASLFTEKEPLDESEER